MLGRVVAWVIVNLLTWETREHYANKWGYRGRPQIIIERGAPLEWQGKRIKPVKLNCRRDMSNGRFA